MARGTPIDQFAKEYLGCEVSFAHLSPDGSICGLTAYADTEYITEEMGVKRTIPLRKNQILMDTSFIQPGQVQKLRGKRRFTLAHECAHQILFQMESETAQSAYAKKYSARTVYSLRDFKTREDWNASHANVLGAAILTPQKEIDLAMWHVAVGYKLINYAGVLAYRAKLSVSLLCGHITV